MQIPIDEVKYIRIEDILVEAYEVSNPDAPTVKLPKGTHFVVSRVLLTEPHPTTGAQHRMYVIKLGGLTKEYCIYCDWWHIKEETQLPPTQEPPLEYVFDSNYKIVRI